MFYQPSLRVLYYNYNSEIEIVSLLKVIIDLENAQNIVTRIFLFFLIKTQNVLLFLFLRMKLFFVEFCSLLNLFLTILGKNHAILELVLQVAFFSNYF